MAGSAIRFIGCVGALTTSLLIGGASAGIAFADNGEASSAGSDASAVTSKSDDNNSDPGPSGASNPEPPSSTVGNGREDVGVQTKEEDKKNGRPTPGTKKFKGSWTIPIFRIPRQNELPASGLPSPSLFYTTVVIPVPTLAELLAAMQPPPPTPAPGPAFRTQEEAPPVVDSGGGGVDPVSVGVAAQPPVLQAPLVIAPLPIPLPPPPVAPLGAAAGTAPAPVVADIAAGARVPLIRGALQPTVEPAASPVTAMSGQPSRLGYPRELRNPTAVELTMLALPGVAGLLMVTVSGGVIGYRQANSARLLRTPAAARFLR